MTTKYGHDIQDSTINEYLHKLKNQIFKLLPLREEDSEWEKWLETLIIETTGVNELFSNKIDFIKLLGKLEALKDLEEFSLYRKTIFESINLVDALKL